MALSERDAEKVEELTPYPRFILGELYRLATQDPAGLSIEASAMPNRGALETERRLDIWQPGQSY